MEKALASKPQGIESKPASRTSSVTRIRIMEVAERHFAQYGIDGASLRQISADAEQRNVNSVQYHFGDRIGLLDELFKYREAQLDAMRRKLLATGRNQDRLDDVKWLLRVCFEPNFRHFSERDGIDYLVVHSHYLTNIRPLGVPHPVDYECPSTKHFREAIARLRERLAFISGGEFDMRLESVGSMFLGAVIQHAHRPPERMAEHHLMFETLLDMMTAAISIPPWPITPPPAG